MDLYYNLYFTPIRKSRWIVIEGQDKRIPSVSLLMYLLIKSYEYGQVVVREDTKWEREKSGWFATQTIVDNKYDLRKLFFWFQKASKLFGINIFTLKSKDTINKRRTIQMLFGIPGTGY